VRCAWWQRWWHRRQLAAAPQTLLPILRAEAERYAEKGLMVNPGDVEHFVTEAFALHQRLPGQAHWQCPCAKTERQR
jgi:hypothetical protein